jgi:hypothetical protein
MVKMESEKYLMVTFNYQRVVMLMFEHNVLILKQKLGMDHCVPAGFD